MIKKIAFWKNCVEHNNIDCFETLESFLTINDVELNSKVKDEILQHLQNLATSLRNYFPKLSEEHNWIRNPFGLTVPLQTNNLSVKENESLLDISEDGTLKEQFKQTSLIDFWVSVCGSHQPHQEVSDKAVKFLMPFVTTYLSEIGFSAYAAIKTKYRNKLDAANDVRVKISPIIPDFLHLCSLKQAQPSH